MTQTVLVIGSGGREHALAWSLSRDPSVGAVHVAPGNPGTALVGTNHPVDALDGDAVAALAVELGATLVVVGPEAPLVVGVADAVRARGIAVFGPSAEAARLEGSKAFAKEIMEAAGVPTADARLCLDMGEVVDALDEFERCIDGVLAKQGPVFVALRVSPGPVPLVPDYGHIHGKHAREAFKAALRAPDRAVPCQE